MTPLSDETADPNGILFESTGSKNLLVSFGGIKMGLGMPVFEFYKSLNGVECDKMFLKDIHQAWYHKGISNECSDIDKVLEVLMFEIGKSDYKNICFMGNSMGGYAAILFGTILNITNIIAFSPQTFIDKENRNIFGDDRWKDQLESVYKYPKAKKEFFDLKKHFNESSFKYSGRIEIYYSINDKLDRVHAELLKAHDCVFLNTYEKGGHQLVKDLRATGKLSEIFEKIFS